MYQVAPDLYSGKKKNNTKKTPLLCLWLANPFPMWIFLSLSILFNTFKWQPFSSNFVLLCFRLQMIDQQLKRHLRPHFNIKQHDSQLATVRQKHSTSFKLTLPFDSVKRYNRKGVNYFLTINACLGHIYLCLL